MVFSVYKQYPVYTECGNAEAVYISSAGGGGGSGNDETPADGVNGEGLLRAGNPAKGPRA